MCRWFDLRRMAGIAAIAIYALHASVADAQRRVALVIGNSTYRHVPTLVNPANDAADVTAALERLEFSVTRVTDGSFDGTRRSLIEFGSKARQAEVAVVFYAGHGIEVAGENWLIPIDAELKTDIDVEHEAITLKSIMTLVSSASKLGLVVLDACRNNPFAPAMQRTLRTRAVSRGLSRVEPNGSVLVAYSAKEGTTAADGAGRNSPYTAALLRHLETPGMEINFLFRNVRDDVLATTGGEQEPFTYGSLSKESIFMKGQPWPGETTSAPVPPPVTSLGPVATPDKVSWNILKDSNDIGSLRRFIEQFPKSQHAAEAQARIAALNGGALPKSLPLQPGAAGRPEKPGPSEAKQTAGVLTSDPPIGSLRTGQRVLVNDGSCPPGQIKEIIGGSKAPGTRQRRCISR